MNESLASQRDTGRFDFRLRGVVGVWLRHYTAFKGGWMIENSSATWKRATKVFRTPCLWHPE
jgi:hypothetical protein